MGQADKARDGDGKEKTALVFPLFLIAVWTFEWEPFCTHQSRLCLALFPDRARGLILFLGDRTRQILKPNRRDAGTR